MLVAETRPPVPSIAPWASTRPRSSKRTWRRNATRTTIILIWTPTSPYNRSRSITESLCFLLPRHTPAWIFISCRYVPAFSASSNLHQFHNRYVDIVYHKGVPHTVCFANYNCINDTFTSYLFLFFSTIFLTYFIFSIFIFIFSYFFSYLFYLFYFYFYLFLFHE